MASTIFLMEGLAAKMDRAVTTVDFLRAFISTMMKGIFIQKLNRYLTDMSCEVSDKYIKYKYDEEWSDN